MKKYFLFTLSLVLFPALNFGGVNLKNGNFYISYTDIVVPGGGKPLEITRTYNSKSIKKGWFGYGWGSDYETYLTVSADGSVIIHENGSGASTRFVPRGSVNPSAAADRIINAMKNKGHSFTASYLGKFKKQLVTDAEKRQQLAERYGVTTKLAKGSTLYSTERGIQTVKKLKKGYARIYNSGKYELFDGQGRIAQIQDKSKGYKVVFSYEDGKIKSIKDSDAKQLFFEWYSDGRVKSISSSGKRKAQYKYNGDDLAEVKDVAGNVYKYDYDGNHNMTKITYNDGSYKGLKYSPKDQFITEIRERNGDKIKYTYENHPKNRDLHYWTLVTKKNAVGEMVTNRYEYEMKKKKDGSVYTHRVLSIVNGFKTETLYSECCSLPLKIQRGQDVTTFKYNKKGLLLEKKSTKGDNVKISYHKKFNKITRVIDKKGWTNFQYDKKGNLAKAENSKGKSVLMVYDRKGRIAKMIDFNKKKKRKRSLAFKYNSQGKPVEIAMAKVGKVSVSYDNFGRIKRFKSKQGQKMAGQITQAFQNLMTIVKPAGVSLNF